MAYFIGDGPVDHALVQIGGAQSPDAAAKHDVVAVVHLGEVIERARLFGIRHNIAASVVLDSDIAFFNIDIRRAVFAHGSQFHQMAFRLDVPGGRRADLEFRRHCSPG